MTWLTPDPGEHPARRLRTLLDGDATLVIPGVFNGLTAILAKDAGAPALWLSGATFSASMGMPDVDLVTLDELARAARQIVRVTRLPLLVDAGLGFGGALNVMRTVRELEGARCAAIQLSEELGADRERRRPEEGRADPGAFVARVAAAVTARQHLVVIAGIDARSEDALDEAVRRGLACREAGADVLFPHGLGSEERLATFARGVPGPLLTDQAERTPNLGAARLAELGYRLVVFPASAALVAAAQVRTLYGDLLRGGDRAGWTGRTLTRPELSDLLGRDGYAALERGLDHGSDDAP